MTNELREKLASETASLKQDLLEIQKLVQKLINAGDEASVRIAEWNRAHAIQSRIDAARDELESKEHSVAVRIAHALKIIRA